MIKLKTIAQTAGIVTVLGLAALGLKKMRDYEPAEPQLEHYKFRIGRTANGNPIEDHDGDGDVDTITSSGSASSTPRVLYVAPDMVQELKGYLDLDRSRKTPRMTPEIQSWATQTREAQRKLEYEMDKERYNRFQATRE
jgi:hypothetical protein